MRIISGIYRNRSLFTVKQGEGYRPATAKVRQAVFSMLEARGIFWPHTAVLDLFAGSGSLGLEALSRGANFVLFAEKNKKATQAITKTIAGFAIPPDTVKVCCTDVLKLLEKKTITAFHLVCIDPPYGKNLLIPTLKKVAENGWLAPDAFVLAEVEATATIDLEHVPPFLDLQQDRLYGQTRILLWKNEQAV